MLPNRSDQNYPCDACSLGRSSSCLVKASVQTERIEPFKRIKNVTANTVFWREGQEPAVVGIVITGVLRLTQTTQDGRQQLLGLHMPSDFFGQLFSHSSGCGLESTGEAQVCTFARHDFERLIESHPRLEHAVMLATFNQLNAARDFAALLGAQRTSERIARFLLACSRLERSTGTRTIHVPVGRRDLAALLNTTPETICRFVKDMVRKRILSVRGASDFAVMAVERLEQVAGKALRDETLPANLHVAAWLEKCATGVAATPAAGRLKIRVPRQADSVEGPPQVIGGLMKKPLSPANAARC